jgi:spore coat polysaccharide biosynthesis protein SpsF
MNKPGVAAVVQARMGSHRLPGKVLIPLRGRPVLWHILHRLRACRSVDTIVVATSALPADDPIEEFCLREKTGVVRGPEDNVLERYLLAARETGADIIVRVTGDSPLVDPGLLDSLVGRLIETGADYCTADPSVPCIHEGFSPFTRQALKKLAAEAAGDRLAREHVTAYFKEHPGFVRTAFLPVDPDHRFEGARLSVDTPSDLSFLEEVYRRLGVPAGEADVREVVRLLRADPGLLEINSHVQRKAPDRRSRRLLLRCDGSHLTGFGHVYRGLALAEELRDGQGFGVSFAVAGDAEAARLVRSADYPVETGPQGERGDLWMTGLLDGMRPDALVLDIPPGEGIPALRRWRDRGGLVATIDDAGETRLAANLAFYPQEAARRRLDWRDFSGKLYAGWEWAVLRRQFRRPLPPSPRSSARVLVTMGGSDPGGMTLIALEALDVLTGDFSTSVVLGPGFSRREELDAFLKKSLRRYDLLTKVEDMASLMSRCDLAVASFGVTAYELAAVGVPALYLCLTQDHCDSAEAFAGEGMGVNLGRFDTTGAEKISEGVASLLQAPSKRVAMSRRARERVDGRGTVRISRVIARCLAGGETVAPAPWHIDGKPL